MSSNPTITINLNPVLEGYCRWIFDCVNRKNPIKLTRDHEIGKHIYSKVRTSRRPSPRPCKINPVSFILPITENNVYEFKTKHVYVNGFDEEQIIDFIDADFRAWCKAKFEIGYFRNFEQRQIVEGILRGLSVRNNADNFEMVKKNDYRNTRRKEVKRFELLLTD